MGLSTAFVSQHSRVLITIQVEIYDVARFPWLTDINVSGPVTRRTIEVVGDPGMPCSEAWLVTLGVQTGFFIASNTNHPM